MSLRFLCLPLWPGQGGLEGEAVCLPHWCVSVSSFLVRVLSMPCFRLLHRSLRETPMWVTEGGGRGGNLGSQPRGGRPAWAAEGQGSYPEVWKMVGVTLDDGAGLLDVTGGMGPSTGPSHAHHRAGARLREEACRQSLLFFTPSPALSASAPAASEGSVLARTHSLRSHLRSSPSVPLSQASGAAFRCMRLPM